jgi:phosphoribosylglycinamide formyltransferase-1
VLDEAPGSRRVGVLISGRGSNLQALIDAIVAGTLNAQIAIVISNKADAAGLDRARAAGIETMALDHRGFPSRDDYDATVANELRSRGVSLVCLAGFMRLVGPRLLAAFPDAILNIHPSLLPAFPGVNAQQQALDHGVKVTGATVHIVTGELDGGPIVLQASVPVRDDDTVDRWPPDPDRGASSVSRRGPDHPGSALAARGAQIHPAERRPPRPNLRPDREHGSQIAVDPELQVLQGSAIPVRTPVRT